MGLGDAPDLGRHGRREQGDLAGRRGLLEHRFDIVDEAHAQHFVGFVEDEAGQFGKIERTAFEVIDDAARRADDDVHAAAQASELRTVGLAPVDRQHVEARDMRGIALEGFGDLDRELARRRQHEGLRPGLAQVEPVQDRQGERGGLAGAGLGLAEQVLAVDQVRNRRRLDRRGRFIADFGEDALQGLAQGEFLEGGYGGRDVGRRAGHGEYSMRRRPESGRPAGKEGLPL